MFCPKCGNELQPGAGFCSGCGSPVGAPVHPQAPAQPQYNAPVEPQAPAQPQYNAPVEPQAPAQPQYTAPAQPQASAMPQYNAPPQPQYRPSAPAPQQQKKTDLIIAIVAIIAVLAVVIGIALGGGSGSGGGGKDDDEEGSGGAGGSSYGSAEKVAKAAFSALTSFEFEDYLATMPKDLLEAQAKKDFDMDEYDEDEMVEIMEGMTSSAASKKTEVDIQSVEEDPDRADDAEEEIELVYENYDLDDEFSEIEDFALVVIECEVGGSSRTAEAFCCKIDGKWYCISVG